MNLEDVCVAFAIVCAWFACLMLTAFFLTSDTIKGDREYRRGIFMNMHYDVPISHSVWRNRFPNGFPVEEKWLEYDALRNAEPVWDDRGSNG